MDASHPERANAPLTLTPRQGQILRAVVSVYVGEGAPVASDRVAQLLPVHLSSASVRNTMAELAELGLVEKPHSSAGRLPTEAGLRIYVDQLIDLRALGRFERRDLEGSLLEGAASGVAQAASRLLSERTRQLGFVALPRMDRVVLRHVTLVRLSRERVLAVLVSHSGVVYRRVVAEEGRADQAELDGMATMLNERLTGVPLSEVRDRLEAELQALRSEAGREGARALALALRALAEPGDDDLVVATRLALLDQPELQEPGRVRQLLEAVETQERLLEVLDQVLREDGVTVAFGNETDEPMLRQCALVAAPYGDPPGVLGVLGPRRMDYARVIPLVDCLSQLVTEELGP